jgi:hypothetical protein
MGSGKPQGDMGELTEADMIWNRACGEGPPRSLPGDRALAIHEQQLDPQYAAMIPSDSSLAERFEERLKSNPSEYAPLRRA